MGSLGPLCSQAFGAGQMERVSLWLQVSVIWPTVIFFPLLAVAWAYSGEIMRLCGVSLSDAVDQAADTYGSYSLLWLWPAMMFNALSMWTESLEVVWPVTIISIVFIGINFLLNWVFVNGGMVPGWNGLGLVGSPIATAVSKMLQIISLWLWIFPVGKTAKKLDVWHGWSRKALDWRFVCTFLRLGVPMAATEAVFDWMFEITTGFAGGISSEGIAAMGVLVNLLFLFQPLQMGIYTAVSVRVGNKLGDGSPDAARLVARVGTMWGCVAALAVGGLLWVLTPWVGYLFTNDADVLEQVRLSMPLLALDMTLSSLSFTAQGILEGQARPELATYAALIGNWAVGLPAAWGFAIPLKWGLPGIWWGTIVGEVVHSAILLVLSYRTDWQLEVKRAEELADADEKEMEDIEKALAGTGTGGGGAGDEGSQYDAMSDTDGSRSAQRASFVSADDRHRWPDEHRHAERPHLAPRGKMMIAGVTEKHHPHRTHAAVQPREKSTLGVLAEDSLARYESSIGLEGDASKDLPLSSRAEKP
jgi:multidrug resistance protein, MATE family